jgi:hypothetical protein
MPAEAKVISAKERVRTLLDSLPDDCTIEDIHYHLYVTDLLRQRLELSETEEGIPHEEVVKRFKQWPKT